MTLIALLLFSFNSMANCIVKLRVFDSPPNYYQDDNGQWRGASVELSVAIIKRAGCVVQYVYSPWKRALYLMSLGKIDMMSNLSITPKRSLYIDFFAEQHTEKVVVVAKKDSDVTINSLEDFKGLAKPVGILAGTFYGEEFAEKIENDALFLAKIAAFNQVETMINALTNNRIIAFLHEEQSMQRMFRQTNNRQNLKIYPQILYENAVYFGLSSKSIDEQLTQKLTLAYNELKTNGELDRILQKYPAVY